MSLETYVVDLIEGKKKNGLLLSLLWLLSNLYKFGVKLRNHFYNKDWLPRKRVDATVVSIGNITAGGTGKTTLVRYLAKKLQKEKKLAILTRGYRSRIEREGRLVDLSQMSELPSPYECGDEPYMLAQALPLVPIWVGTKRTQSAEGAVNDGCNLLILDDGMQYRELQRDLEIVIVDAEDPFGNGHFLPRGFLRDDPKRLSNADLVVVNHVYTNELFAKVESQLRRYTKAPLVGVRYTFINPPVMNRVGLFCALGKPDRFISNVPAQIVDTMLAPDHRSFSKKELQDFAASCKRKGAEMLVCTEKDYVKVPPMLKTVIPIVPLKADLEFTFGKEEFEKILQRM